MFPTSGPRFSISRCILLQDSSISWQNYGAGIQSILTLKLLVQAEITSPLKVAIHEETFSETAFGNSVSSCMVSLFRVSRNSSKKPPIHDIRSAQ